MAGTSGQWQVARAALSAVTTRFADLIPRAAPDAPATPDWTVADTAAHVTGIAAMYTTVLAPDPAPVPLRAVAEFIPTVTVETVAELNDLALRHFTERDTGTLASAIKSTVDHILHITEHTDPERTVPWLGDSQVPVGGVLAHLVNEMLVHGRDIARAAHEPWPMPPHESATFFELFVVGMIRNDVGQVLDGPPPNARRIAVAFTSRYTTPVTLVLHNGDVSVEEPGGPVDARVSFDPATLNLMLFGRIGRARAALTGKLFVSGRRPWLLPTFLRKVRLPTNSLPLSTAQNAVAER
jgi:uncharacterized protein (TIGR03083 family)